MQINLNACGSHSFVPVNVAYLYKYKLFSNSENSCKLNHNWFFFFATLEQALEGLHDEEEWKKIANSNDTNVLLSLGD